MIFEQIRAGGDRNFAYLIGDPDTGSGVIVDPSTDPGKVIERARAHSLKIVYLINSHAHSDHTEGNEQILSQTGSELLGGEIPISDGDVRQIGKIKLTFLHTPGHTPESLCLLVQSEGDIPDKLITGDTLFVGKVGGTGFGEDARQEYESLHQKILTLPDETEVWPGHDYGSSPQSTVGNERRTNPFLLRPDFEGFIDLKRNWLVYKKEHGIA